MSRVGTQGLDQLGPKMSYFINHPITGHVKKKKVAKKKSLHALLKKPSRKKVTLPKFSWDK